MNSQRPVKLISVYTGIPVGHLSYLSTCSSLYRVSQKLSERRIGFSTLRAESVIYFTSGLDKASSAEENDT